MQGPWDKVQLEVHENKQAERKWAGQDDAKGELRADNVYLVQVCCNAAQAFWQSLQTELLEFSAVPKRFLKEVQILGLKDPKDISPPSSLVNRLLETLLPLYNKLHKSVS